MLKILIVDDSPEFVEQLYKDLGSLVKKYKDEVDIVKAYSVPEACSYIKEIQFDAIIVDYKFKYGMGGDDLLEEIYDPFNIIYFVLISGADEGELSSVLDKIAYKSGKQITFIKKPYSLPEIQNIYTNIKQFISGRPLPFPLSNIYQKYKSENGQQKFYSLISFFETFLKLSLPLIIEDLERNKVVFRAELMKESAKVIGFNRHTSFGTWINWSQMIIEKYFVDFKGSVMPQIINFYTKSYANLKIFDLLHKFKQLRNKASHNINPEDDWYNFTLEQEYKAIETFFQNIKFLSAFPIFTPEKIIRIVPNLNIITYEIKVLVGGEPFQRINIDVKSTLNEREVYTFSKNNNPISLYPFFSFNLCKICGTQKLFILNSISNGQYIALPICQHDEQQKVIKFPF